MEGSGDLSKVLRKLKKAIRTRGGVIKSLEEREDGVYVRAIFKSGPVLFRISREVGYPYWEGGERKVDEGWEITVVLRPVMWVTSV